MKIQLLCCTVFLLIGTMMSVQARLGETPEEMQARLGPPTPQRGPAQVNVNGHLYPYGESLNYSKEGWSIGCVFVDGVCVKISYIKSAPFTDDDLRTIFNNEAQGSKWAQTTSTTTMIDSLFLPTMKVREWKRTDGAEAQIIDKQLTLITPAFHKAVEAANQRAKADAEKKMPDL